MILYTVCVQVEDLLANSSELKRLLLRFDNLSDGILAARAAAQAGKGEVPPATWGPREPPLRFADPTTRRLVCACVRVCVCGGGGACARDRVLCVHALIGSMRAAMT